MCTDIWSVFAPGIAKQVETLLIEGRVGICAGTLRYINLTTSCTSLSREPNPRGDRFQIVIPYAGHSVIWEVIMNCHNPADPPDFVFGVRDKDEDFQPDIDAIPSLVNWDASDPRCLMRVIDELLEEYKKYQHRLIDQHSRLKFEYSALLEVNEYNPEDVEVHIVKNSANRLGPVNFLIRLPINFKRMPAYLTKENPGNDSAVLIVTFQTPDGAKVTPQLFLSPRIEHILGGVDCLRISQLPNGGCLVDYVPGICELLNTKVEQVLQSHERKKDYITAFIEHFASSIVEYDTEGFSKLSFLLEWHDFFFMITVDVPLLFPAEQPRLMFQSIYHASVSGAPYSKVTTEYPYSPRWSGIEMAARARTFILENIGSFQRASVTDGTL